MFIKHFFGNLTCLDPLKTSDWCFQNLRVASPNSTAEAMAIMVDHWNVPWIVATSCHPPTVQWWRHKQEWDLWSRRCHLVSCHSVAICTTIGIEVVIMARRITVDLLWMKVLIFVFSIVFWKVLLSVRLIWDSVSTETCSIENTPWKLCVNEVQVL